MSVFEKLPKIQDLAETGTIGSFIRIEESKKGEDYGNYAYAPEGFAGALKTEYFMNIPRKAVVPKTLPDGRIMFFIMLNSNNEAPLMESMMPEMYKTLKQIAEKEKSVKIQESMVERKERIIARGTSEQIKQHARNQNRLTNRIRPEGYLDKGENND